MLQSIHKMTIIFIIISFYDVSFSMWLKIFKLTFVNKTIFIFHRSKSDFSLLKIAYKFLTRFCKYSLTLWFTIFYFTEIFVTIFKFYLSNYNFLFFLFILNIYRYQDFIINFNFFNIELIRVLIFLIYFFL